MKSYSLASSACNYISIYNILIVYQFPNPSTKAYGADMRSVSRTLLGRGEGAFILQHIVIIKVLIGSYENISIILS